MRPMVFVDNEATGLDWRIHQVCEIAWALGDEEPNVLVPPHTLEHADPKALEVNRYFERALHTQQLSERDWARARVALAFDLTGVQLVAANPAYDAGGLAKLLGYAPWHFRLRDIEEKAATIFGWPDSRGMRAIAEELRARGHAIPENDHTAAQDVRCLRASWYALDAERARLGLAVTAA